VIVVASEPPLRRQDRGGPKPDGFVSVPCCRGESRLALSDLPLDELVHYQPAVAEPDDFDDFWQRTLTEARTHDLEVTSQPVDTPFRTVTVYDVSFSGYAGDRISAWLTTPRGVDGLLQGVSQGGGLALAVAGLVPDLLAVMPDVPFLCHFRRALEVSETNPYEEITRYLSVRRQTVDQVFSTLSYFDAVNFAKRANAPALFSVALRDLTCPPSTV